MKYGANIYVWAERFTDEDLLFTLDRAARLGLSFLEIPVGDDVQFDAARVGKSAAELGIELMLSPGGLWPMECDISLADAEQRQQGVLWHKRALDRCGECGAMAYAGAIYGHPGHIGPRPPDDAEVARIAAALHELAEHAQSRGARLVLEPMSHFRTHVANTPRQVLNLIDQADHANISILLDTYHMVTEVTSYGRAIMDASPRLWGMHACDNNRGAPGTGLVPWDEIVKALRDCRWDGHIGFESYNSRVRDGEFAYSRRMFHNVCPDGDAFVRAARQFMETKFAALTAR